MIYCIEKHHYNVNLFLTTSIQVEELNPTSPPSSEAHDLSACSSAGSSNSITTCTPFSKKRKRGKDSDVDEAIIRSLKQLEERREKKTQQKYDILDEEDLFGRQVSSVLRRLPDRQRALAKIKVQQLLFDIEFSEDGSTDDLHRSSFFNF